MIIDAHIHMLTEPGYDDKSFYPVYQKKEITFYQNADDQAHPFDRIVFGTDVPIPEMAQAKNEYHQILTALDVPDPVCKKT